MSFSSETGSNGPSPPLPLVLMAAFLTVVLLQVLTARLVRRPNNDNALHVDGNEETADNPPEPHARFRSDLHLNRRFQHAATGILVVALSYVIPPHPHGSALLLFGAALLLCLHRWRLSSPRGQDLYLRLFGSLLRPHERKGLPGAFHFLLGTAFATSFYPDDVARCSVLCLSLGDPTAAIVGITYGGLPFDGRSTMAGCSACFIVSTACGWSILRDGGWAAATTAGLASTTAELTAWHLGMDDNLFIPVATGAAINWYRWAF